MPRAGIMGDTLLHADIPTREGDRVSSVKKKKEEKKEKKRKKEWERMGKNLSPDHCKP